MQKQIQIQSVNVIKTGTNPKTQKQWTLFKVQCSGDDEMKEFSTFNGDYQNNIGQQMTGAFEYSEKWKNWNEISASQEKENEKHNEIMEALRKIYELIDEMKTPTIITGKGVDEVNIPKGE